MTPSLAQPETNLEPVAVRDEAAELPETVVRPASGWNLLELLELWQYRDLLLTLTWRNVSIRYKQTVLGVAWAVLQPTLTMAVFAVVFGRLAKLPSDDLPYPLFVFAGLLPWTFFSTAVTSAAMSVIENEQLVTKVYFPRLAIPLGAVGAALVDFAIAFSVLLALMAVYGVVPGWSLIVLPLALLLLLMAAIGVGALLAALNVSYRDFRYVVGFLLQLWMFGTPTIYMAYDLVAVTPTTETSLWWATLRAAVHLNPITALIVTFRASVLSQPIPWSALGTSALGITVLFLVGLIYFRRVEDTFADVI